MTVAGMAGAILGGEVVLLCAGAAGEAIGYHGALEYAAVLGVFILPWTAMTTAAPAALGAAAICLAERGGLRPTMGPVLSLGGLVGMATLAALGANAHGWALVGPFVGSCGAYAALRARRSMRNRRRTP